MNISMNGLMSSSNINLKSHIPLKNLIKEKLKDISVNKCQSSSVNYPIGGVVIGNLTLNTIQYEDVKLKFKQPYKLNYNTKNGYFYADDIPLNIYCSGKNLDEVREDINVCLAIEWKMYVECDIDELSNGAKKLREFLSSKLERIE